jgi:hypothetical protein
LVSKVWVGLIIYCSLYLLFRSGKITAVVKNRLWGERSKEKGEAGVGELGFGSRNPSAASGRGACR